MRASKARAGRRAGTSVSQALERIRKAARERKKERFTALLHHISVELLEEAFFALEQNAAPGVDRLTWKDYEADLERNIADLHATGPTGSVSGTAVPARVHPQAGRSAAPARGRDVGCIMHLAQFGFGDGGASRGEFATQSRSL